MISFFTDNQGALRFVMTQDLVQYFVEILRQNKVELFSRPQHDSGLEIFVVNPVEHPQSDLVYRLRSDRYVKGSKYCDQATCLLCLLDSQCNLNVCVPRTNTEPLINTVKGLPWYVDHNVFNEIVKYIYSNYGMSFANETVLSLTAKYVNKYCEELDFKNPDKDVFSKIKEFMEESVRCEQCLLSEACHRCGKILLGKSCFDQPPMSHEIFWDLIENAVERVIPYRDVLSYLLAVCGSNIFPGLVVLKEGKAYRLIRKKNRFKFIQTRMKIPYDAERPAELSSNNPYLLYSYYFLWAAIASGEFLEFVDKDGQMYSVASIRFFPEFSLELTLQSLDLHRDTVTYKPTDTSQITVRQCGMEEARLSSAIVFHTAALRQVVAF